MLAQADPRRPKRALARRAPARSVTAKRPHPTEAEESAEGMSIFGRAQGQLMKHGGLSANEALITLTLHAARLRTRLPSAPELVTMNPGECPIFVHGIVSVVSELRLRTTTNSFDPVSG
jgi:hypothetical protein